MIAIAASVASADSLIHFAGTVERTMQGGGGGDDGGRWGGGAMLRWTASFRIVNGRPWPDEATARSLITAPVFTPIRRPCLDATRIGGFRRPTSHVATIAKPKRSQETR